MSVILISISRLCRLLFFPSHFHVRTLSFLRTLINWSAIKLMRQFGNKTRIDKNYFEIRQTIWKQRHQMNWNIHKIELGFSFHMNKITREDTRCAYIYQCFWRNSNTQNTEAHVVTIELMEEIERNLCLQPESILNFEGKVKSNQCKCTMLLSSTLKKIAEIATVDQVFSFNLFWNVKYKAYKKIQRKKNATKTHRMTTKQRMRRTSRGMHMKRRWNVTAVFLCITSAWMPSV